MLELFLFSFVFGLLAQVPYLTVENHTATPFLFIQQQGHGVPPARIFPTLGFDDDGMFLYVIGGYVDGFPDQFFYRIDLNSSTWEQLPFKQLSEVSCSAQYQGYDGIRKGNGHKNIYFYEGESGWMNMYNVTSNEVSFFSQFNGPKIDKPSCTVSYNSDFFLFGGSTENATCSDQLHKFSPIHGWGRIEVTDQVVPPGRVASGLTHNETHLFLFGGKCELSFMKPQIWCFDLANRTWSILPVKKGSPLPPPRSYHLLLYDWIAPNPRLIIFGGHGKELLNDVWMFDINDETWSQVGLPLIGKGSWPSPREMFGSAYYGGRFIVFGGNSAHNMATNELWQFVMNKDCQWKTTCQDCSLVIGCGWCEGNDVPYKVYFYF
eukprot:TRINITY_DN3747_c0_g1_i8.p1 TRINITY_DN3747_c0_g1~~TRINITY_DN3747_c0_g1_i8.p1  ORF type:complete len:377 (-),score=66.76 TRINITY_DN3747_c0_g1_i8:497-1627(-)